MNNSLGRLFEGMIDTIRHDIIPAMEGEFVRGQAFGVIFLLENLKRRTSWSTAFLAEQVAALVDLQTALEGLDAPADMPSLSKISAEDEVSRDAGDAEVAALIDWLILTPWPAASQAIDTYLSRQIRYELVTSAKPMFAEISLGREQEGPHS